MRFLRLSLVLVLALVPAFAQGAPITRVVVFGDSLSDTGNAYAITGNTFPPAPPFAAGRFSNGPVWVEHVASRLGLAVNPSLLGGTNYAAGGAEAKGTLAGGAASPLINFSASPPVFIAAVPSLSTQVSSFLAAGGPKPGDLVVVLIGPNDLFNNPSAATVGAALGGIQSALQTLLASGANQFLIANLPPLGNIPFPFTPAERAGLNALAAGFNIGLDQLLDALRAAFPGRDFTELDLAALIAAIQANPAAFGFTNVTDSALFTGSDPNTFLFWDTAHPTARGHALIAGAALQALGIIPEPTTLAMCLVGFAGVGLAYRRKPRR